MAVYQNNQFRLLHDNYRVDFASFMGRDLGEQLTGLLQRYDIAKLIEISEKVFCEVAHLEDKNYELFIGLTNYYFENIWTMCKMDIFNGKNAIALNKYRSCLEIVMNYEKARNQKFHKGTPYFFLGYCYLINGNLDLAFQMIHNGHMENLRVYQKLGLPLNEAPSYLVMSLDSNNPHNYMIDYVLLMKEKVMCFITQHNALSPIKTSFENFEVKFLQRVNEKFDDVRFLFVYLIMTLINLNLPDDQQFSKNYFSNIRKIELMFELSLIIDKTLYEKYGNEFFTSGVSKYLIGAEMSFDTLKSRLSYQDRSNFSFNDNSGLVVKGLLDNKINYEGKPIDYRFRSMLLACYLRNFSAHNLSGMNEVLEESYTTILVMLFSALFFAADTLNSN